MGIMRCEMRLGSLSGTKWPLGDSSLEPAAVRGMLKNDFTFHFHIFHTTLQISHIKVDEITVLTKKYLSIATEHK